LIERRDRLLNQQSALTRIGVGLCVRDQSLISQYAYRLLAQSSAAPI